MSNSSTTRQILIRDYNRIFTGTNQLGGYENPFLGFSTDTTAFTLKADKSTYFHYPNTATQTYLSASDLIKAGAFAGSIPFKSDKIFKKTANYKSDTYWGDAIPEYSQRGVWLCAWLSGNEFNPTQNPIWMDRWFKPGYFDTSYTSFLCSTSAVYDEPSCLTFDPGVWYRYDHIGNNSNLQIVSMLCCLKIHIDNWAALSLDTSNNDNNAILQNYSSIMIASGVNPNEITNDTSLKLNGNNQYAQILYNTNFDVSGNIACNVWVKSNNWSEQPSHHIISNGLRGGWAINYNNGFFTPFNILLDQSGNVIFNNQNNNFYTNIILPGTPKPVGLGIDSELYTWILDNGIYDGQKHLYKLDYNGNIDNAVYFSSAIELYDTIIDKNNLVWISCNQPYISAFNTNCELVSTTNLSGTKLVINSLNSLTAFNSIDACVFDDSYYWTINNSGNVYFNNTLILSSLSATNVQSSKDYVWILCDSNKIYKYEKDTNQLTNVTTFNFVASTTLTDSKVTTISGKNLFFTNEFVDGINRDFIWVLYPETNYLYKLDTALNIIQKTNTTFLEHPIQNCPILGDASGYQWHKNFNYKYLKAPKTSQIEGIVYLGTESILVSGQKYKTIIPVSALTRNDWHMFTFNISNNVELYTDTILRDSIIVPTSSTVYYKYETPLTLGTNIGKIDILNSELDYANGIYHQGEIDDLRVYTNILNVSDIFHIYLTKFNFKDIVWDMPTGTYSYLEEITRFFKFKMPGQKSQFYNIHLRGLQIQNEDTRQIIEGIIKEAIQKITPFYTSLYKIIWD